MENLSLKGKNATLGDRPSLLEFLVCRESVLSNIDKAKKQEEDVPDMYKQIAGVKTRSVAKGPTDEELAEQYGQQMEDMFE